MEFIAKKIKMSLITHRYKTLTVIENDQMQICIKNKAIIIFDLVRTEFNLQKCERNLDSRNYYVSCPKKSLIKSAVNVDMRNDRKCLYFLRMSLFL